MKLPAIIMREEDGKYVHMDESGFLINKVVNEPFEATIFSNQDLLDEALEELNDAEPKRSFIKRWDDDKFIAVPVSIKVTIEK